MKVLLAVAALALTAQAPHEAAREAAARFDFDAAATRYRDLLADEERQYGASSATMARTLVEAARLPNWTDRAGAWRRAIEILQVAAPQDPALAEALYRAGVEAQVKKDEPAARAYYQRALRTAPSRGIRARVLHNLAIMAAAGDAAMAEEYLRQEIELEQQLGTTIRLATALEACSAVLEQTGRGAEAAEMKTRAEAVRAQAGRRTSSPPPGRGVYRAGAEVMAPSLESKQEPEYSAEASVARLQGTVVLSVEIGTDGVARNLRVLRQLGMGLDEQAALAVQRWRFRPGTRDGEPVTVAATIEVNFRLL